ncbi:hypothetical protein [Hymenobacter aerilatus]|uniref:hypothetical protein n=1 Tax=Hymenobacter aerilatus TaxID=2932251 RepID=UPI0035CB2FD1
MQVLQALTIFTLAVLCEIGGGYLVWLWLKEDRPWWYGLLGADVLRRGGVVATWHSVDLFESGPCEGQRRDCRQRAYFGRDGPRLFWKAYR